MVYPQKLTWLLTTHKGYNGIYCGQGIITNNLLMAIIVIRIAAIHRPASGRNVSAIVLEMADMKTSA